MKEGENVQEILEELKKINNNLEELKNKEQIPKLLYTKDIAENYHVNRNKATELCKKYGTNFGGWCIEASKLGEVLKNARQDFLD